MTEHLDPAGHHDESDYEDTPPEPATMSSLVGNKVVEDVAGIYVELGLLHTLEPGWTTRNPGYNWYPNAPRGIMLHHTGTATYEARRAYPTPEGTRTDGTTICQMLVQLDGAVNFISTDPANYSSGLNWKGILDDFVEKEKRFHGPQSGPLGPTWYGNREWVNIEVVNLGNGATMTKLQEDAVIQLCAIVLSVLHTDATGLIAHADGRGTKQDPRWDGPVGEPPYTIAEIQDAVQVLLDENRLPGGNMDCPWKNNVPKGSDWYTDYPACNNHFDGGESLEWRVNTGVCAVPTWGDEAIQWNIDTKRINVRDTSRDDFRENLTTGRYWAFEYRAR